MFRALALSLPIMLAGLPAALALPAPVAAQTPQLDCATAPPKKKKKGLGAFGKLAGSLAGDMIRGSRPSLGYGLGSNLFSSSLVTAFAALLDEKEQKQAVCATDKVIERGEKGEIGASESWTSESRKDVTGTSTVVAANTLGDGTRCMNVTDVVTVDGEETKVNKRMCRGPGQTRYAMV